MQHIVKIACLLNFVLGSNLTSIYFIFVQYHTHKNLNWIQKSSKDSHVAVVWFPMRTLSPTGIQKNQQNGKYNLSPIGAKSFSSNFFQERLVSILQIVVREIFFPNFFNPPPKKKIFIYNIKSEKCFYGPMLLSKWWNIDKYPTQRKIRLAFLLPKRQCHCCLKTVSYDKITYLTSMSCSARCLHSAKLALLPFRWTSIRNEKFRWKWFLVWNSLGKESASREPWGEKQSLQKLQQNLKQTSFNSLFNRWCWVNTSLSQQ